MLELLDPCANFAKNKLVYAERPKQMRGLRIGLIENTKVNAADVLQRIGGLLVGEHGAEVANLYHKKHASTPVNEALIAEVARSCDVVIAGVGDCGSCSSATILDGIIMEQIGRPAASIVTNVFVNTGRAMAKQWGAPGYKFVVVPHPVANLSSMDLNRLARGAIDDILERLLKFNAETSGNPEGLK